MAQEDSAAIARELGRATVAITDVIVPLYLALGEGGADRIHVVPRLRRIAPEVRLRALFRTYEKIVGGSDDAQIVRTYVLG